MNNASLAIGVFDSGMGGLTVLRALKEVLPAETFIYLGDTARLPYGTKSPDTIRQYAVQMARILVEKRIKALVIACNTATTAALEYLQTMLPDLPVIGVVNPGAWSATQISKNRKIAVLATETTIASRAYHNCIAEYLPGAMITGRACSVLVALAEEGMVNNTVAKEALTHYLEHIQDEDTILLGCTHFPVFKPLLKTLLPAHINIVDSAQATARHLQDILENKKLLRMTSDKLQNTQYLVTDSVMRFQSVGEIFLGQSLLAECIELVDVQPMALG